MPAVGLAGMTRIVDLTSQGRPRRLSRYVLQRSGYFPRGPGSRYMPISISNKDFEKFYFSKSCVGVVDVYKQHVQRIAEILSRQYPGIIFYVGSSDQKRHVHPLCREGEYAEAASSAGKQTGSRR